MTNNNLYAPASDDDIAAVINVWSVPLPPAWQAVFKVSNGFNTEYKYANPPFEAYDTDHLMRLKRLGITIVDDPYRLSSDMAHILPIAEDASGGFYGLDSSTLTANGECAVVHFESGEEDGRYDSIFAFLERSFSESDFDRIRTGLPDSFELPVDQNEAFVSAAEHGHLGKVMRLLADGTDIDYVARHGVNALISTTWGEHEAVMEFLVNNGADVNQRCSNGTALTESARMGNANMVDLLLRSGADVNVNSENGTALFQSIEYAGRPDRTPHIMHILLEHGADPNLGNSVGTTPLFVAAGKNNTTVMIDLLAHGADVNQKTIGGYTALSWARDHKNLEAVALLEQAGAVG